MAFWIEAFMFARIIDDLKDSTSRALQLTSLAGVMALALFIATSFLCAAGFVYMLQRYGLIYACLSGAVVFLVVAVIASACYMVRARKVKARVSETRKSAKSAVQTALADPMVVAAGLQMIRAIGVKKLIPIIAVGGLALGFLVSRNHSSDEAPAE
jgi:uncharacterized membrane protein (DUF441 family)